MGCVCEWARVGVDRCLNEDHQIYSEYVSCHPLEHHIHSTVVCGAHTYIMYSMCCTICTYVCLRTYVHTVHTVPICVYMYMSHWHGNVRGNNDSKSRRRTLNASRVNLNCVDARRGHSVRDDKWMYSDTASAPRLHSVRCLEDPVCRQSAGL